MSKPYKLTGKENFEFIAGFSNNKIWKVAIQALKKKKVKKERQ